MRDRNDDRDLVVGLPEEVPCRPGGNAPDRSFARGLGAVVVAGLTWRLVYWLYQPASDPNWARPLLDGALYWEWAEGLVRGAGEPSGAFYLAPLYPHFLAAAFLVGLGARGVLLVQHLLSVATAATLACVARDRAGRAAGWTAAVLYLVYHPFAYYASRPLGETLALFLASLSLWAVERRSSGGAVSGGALSGLTSLARPNLLLVPGLWAVGELVGRRWRRGAVVAAGLALVLGPVAVRNYVASGHWVPISSNGGITAWHGNGPGAQGVYTPQPGLSGDVDTQREEARRLAEAETGRDLDAVEADRWWGGRALRLRLTRPWDSLALLGKRTLMTLGPWEYGLAYHPSLDTNPFRATWRHPGEVPLLPFTVLAALAAAGLLALGPSKSGGWRLWAAVASAAAAPILFYVSSRYRLPLAAFLVVPAGAGFVALADLGGAGTTRARRLLGGFGAVACVALALLLPTADLRRADLAAALTMRAATLQRAEQYADAEGWARRAVEVNPASPIAWFNLGVVLERTDRTAEAEQCYRRALGARLHRPEAAGNLASLLTRVGRPDEAVPILQDALTEWPAQQGLWNNLVVALAAAGRTAEAREAAAEAERRGVTLPQGLLEAIGAR